ncbi:protein LNK2-like isoform X3 [Rhodamnia argentea]|uniref:Protein LNK2-like isoform X3 n=1 Tax=Rhodamnia argentea TaxID=178133 RepID=A0ABM3HD71_9MYRT|nr:protein LNK2-like isoform X3 [Rhodamnia argentea]
MFDWNDEELTNIIWGEAGENGEHIVPYPAGKEDDQPKQVQNEDIATLRPSEQKALLSKLDLRGMKLECFNRNNKNGGIFVSSLDSWPYLSPSEAAKDEQGSVGAGVPDNVTEINEYNSSKGGENAIFCDTKHTAHVELTRDISNTYRQTSISPAETAQHDADTDIFENTQGKEHTDFADYGWENISSFDDLDRIFSNDDPIFGEVNLDNADEIWSSSKDATSSPVKSFSVSADCPGLISGALTSSSEILQVKTEYEHQDEQSFNLGYDKMNEPASISFQQRNVIVEPVVKDQKNMAMVGKTHAENSHLFVDSTFTLNERADKVYRQKTPYKSQKKSREKAEGKLSQDIYGSRYSHVDLGGQYSHQLSPFPSSIYQLSGTRGNEPTHYQQISDPYAQSAAFRNYAESFPAIISPTSFQSGEVMCQTVFPGYEVSAAYVDSTGKRLDSPGKPPTMTPQEKIEKLRRRQQMQAMLAIKKQLQQFGDQVSSPSDAQMLTLESPNQHSKGAHLEVDDLSSLPSTDISSSIEQDSSTFVSAAVDGRSIEDVVLNRLQDVIAKLDDRTRICIRDSLYRLAKSAVKRQHTGNVIGTVVHPQEHEVLAKEEAEALNREVKPADVETDTNPIDRVVANLLFHGPLGLSAKLPATPESSISPKLPNKHKAQEVANVQNEGLSKISKTELQTSLQGSGSTDQMTDTHQIDQFKNSPCMDMSENAYVPTEGGAGDLESSQEQLNS